MNELFTQYVRLQDDSVRPNGGGPGRSRLSSHISGTLEWVIGALIVLRTILQGFCQMQITLLKAIDRMQAISSIQAIHSFVLLVALWGCYVRWRSVSVVVATLVVAQLLELALEAAWIRRLGVKIGARFTAAIVGG